MKVSQTSGNSRNGIKGSRVTIRNNAGHIVDRFVVPHWSAKYYCSKHPNGKYGKRYAAAVAEAISHDEWSGEEE